MCDIRRCLKSSGQNENKHNKYSSNANRPSSDLLQLFHQRFSASTIYFNKRTNPLFKGNLIKDNIIQRTKNKVPENTSRFLEVKAIFIKVSLTHKVIQFLSQDLHELYSNFKVIFFVRQNVKIVSSELINGYGSAAAKLTCQPCIHSR